VTDAILRETGQHLFLVVVSTAVAVAIGVPLGLLLVRRAAIRRGVLGAAAVAQTVPSLALFGLLLPAFGIGTPIALIALTVYALLPILRNTVTGIESVDPAVREAGRGMGMTDRQLLFQVELPLATATIMAGVRVATVVGIGVATVAAPIGAGGLGTFIFQGLASSNDRTILAGAVPAACLAVAADAALGALERRLRPPA
jgi:osmoprotectant transport system permease protein